MSQLPSSYDHDIGNEIITPTSKQVYITEQEYQNLQNDRSLTSHSQIGAQILSQSGSMESNFQDQGMNKHQNCGHLGKSPGVSFPIQSTVLHSSVPGITPPVGYHGVAGCILCKGAGYVKNKKDRALPCPDCVRDTRYCAVCNNTGYRIYDKKKKCKCIFAPKK
jgi:hypothetical protein